MSKTQTTIYCTSAVRALWPDPLAHQWLQQYPDIFDAEDVRLSQSQPGNHFCEWFAAIHLFHRDGALSLVEKYVYKRHAGKRALMEKLLSERERNILDQIQADHKVQPPDLFVYVPMPMRYWFAEVKGPGDRLSAKQIHSHDAITGELGVPVEIIQVKISGL